MNVSFVVPAYNEEAQLPACLSAIAAEIARTKVNAEVIVVDNASTDRTAEVARGFPGVTVVHEPEKGLVQARRAGFAVTAGDLVANVDADTIVPEGWLAKVLEEFAADASLVALSGPYIYHDVPRRYRIATKGFYYLGYGFYVLNRFILKVGSMVQGGNFVVRREALTRIGGYNMAFQFYGEDTDIARRLTKVGRVKFTFALPAYSSGRRLVSEGLVKMGVRYALNFVWATFRKKPFTDEWVDVRSEPRQSEV